MPMDLNCDMGESFGTNIVGQDENIMPFVTSSNIACGFHGGDPVHIEKTIQLAIKHNIRIGAHPSYPDLEGFGRRPMKLPKEELKSILRYQIAALKGMVESAGGKLSYVKPHGALYNTAAHSRDETLTIIEAIQSIDPKLALMGFAGSVMQKEAKAKGMAFIAEAFADRRYEPDGSLMSRSKEGAVLTNVEDVVDQVRNLVEKQRVKTSDGTYISVKADSICVHGDNPSAPEIVKVIREFLIAQNGS